MGLVLDKISKEKKWNSMLQIHVHDALLCITYLVRGPLTTFQAMKDFTTAGAQRQIMNVLKQAMFAFKPKLRT